MAPALPCSYFSISTFSSPPYEGSSIKLNILKNNPKQLKFGRKESNVFSGFLNTNWYTSLWLLKMKRLLPSGASSSSASSGNESCKMNCNWVDRFVWVLHESARRFSSAIKHQKSVRNSPELTKAWIGMDVHSWHRHIAYQAAVYAMLSTAMEAKYPHPNTQSDCLSSVHKILSPIISSLSEFIDIQLKTKDPELVNWFKMVKLPLLSGLCIPLFRRWSKAFGQSGVAEVTFVVTSCIAARKLGDGRVSCPMFTQAIPDTIEKLMDLLQIIVSMDRLHSLASEAGFEHEFLSHYGAKVLPNKKSQEVAFWIGLVQKKLSVAFYREHVISSLQTSHHNRKDLDKDLAILGLLAFLGRRTRLFFCDMCIKDLDEHLRKFLSFLECGGLFIYPEFSSLSIYQLFVEVVAEEIRWLDIYASIPSIKYPERKRSKQHAIQAEKEIILSAVFNVCSDVFSGFAYFINSTEQPLNANVKAFLHESQNLLNICLDDYWAAYYRSGELLICEEFPQPITLLEKLSKSEAKPLCPRLVRNTVEKMILTTRDIMMGTRLLFLDISIAMGILLRQLRGNKLTEREKKKLKKTLADFTSFIPITILMLLPLSPVGHAAILAAIKKYMPCLIPSSYSSARLDMVKQLNKLKDDSPVMQQKLKSSPHGPSI